MRLLCTCIQVIALYDYDAEDDQELDLEEGDIVAVIFKEDRIWWCGSCGGKIGMFPSTYVTAYSEGIFLYDFNTMKAESDFA